MRRVQFVIEQRAQALAPFLPAIQALADSEKESLGFLRAKAFEDAIARHRLIAAVVQDGEVTTLAGFILYSGVYPDVKVQQIAVVPDFRKKGAASALMKALIAELERTEFLGLRADVASDLVVALAFYAKHGFEKKLNVPEGGRGGVQSSSIRDHLKRIICSR